MAKSKKKQFTQEQAKPALESHLWFRVSTRAATFREWAARLSSTRKPTAMQVGLVFSQNMTRLA